MFGNRAGPGSSTHPINLHREQQLPTNHSGFSQSPFIPQAPWMATASAARETQADQERRLPANYPEQMYQQGYSHPDRYRTSSKKCPLLTPDDTQNYPVVISWLLLVRAWAPESNYNLVELIQVVRTAYGEKCEALLRCAEILNPEEVQNMLDAK